jgi:hypothetical protein
LVNELLNGRVAQVRKLLRMGLGQDFKDFAFNTSAKDASPNQNGGRCAA